MALTPQQVAEKWARRAAGASQDLTNGVNDVRVAPGIQAAEKQDKMIQKWLASVQSGKWAENVSAVSLADWKAAMIQKGVPRYSQGVQAAQGKFQAFMAELLPFQANLSAQIATMPDLTLEDSIARMTAQVRGMANFRR